MQIKRILKVTSEEFYENIVNGIWNDIKENADRRYRKMDIKEGFKYTKNTRNGAARQEFEIVELKNGECYTIRMNQYADYMIISYHTKEVENGLEVTMDQYLDSYEKIKDKKSKFFRWWSNLIYFSRMSQTLYDLESDIEYARDKLKRPDDSLIPKHYKKMVKNINKQVLSNSEKRNKKLEQKRRIEAKKAAEKNNTK